MLVTARRTLRYANTEIELIEGSPLDHPNEAMYVAVNARGVLASGLAGAIRLAAGPEVERELRLHGDLLVGSAYLIGPGKLAPRGVRVIACGVTSQLPGVSPRQLAVMDAFSSALTLLDRERVRGVTIPEIGTRVQRLTLAQGAEILTNSLIGTLRRGSALDHVTIAGLHPEYLQAVRDGLLLKGASLA